MVQTKAYQRKKKENIKYAIRSIKHQEKELKDIDIIYSKKDKYRKNRLKNIHKEIKKYKINLAKYELDFSLINKILRKNFPEQKSTSRATNIRGYRSQRVGYIVNPPNDYSNYSEIIIEYYTGLNTSKEEDYKRRKRFNDKLKPLLRENGIKFTIKNQDIFIRK